ncbi:hypothetical protein LAZ67_5002796 [Cordylochernes scorpioides]|uniref:Reverse transcriptase n=1 Tax=Cordylochernes scorpioides TaxID=51811 RepID=A0ABY6KGZ1_9ARAC|nr:hypothetical protein LAZ67_5002796 [Cordylochernes scorpioides]
MKDKTEEPRHGPTTSEVVLELTAEWRFSEWSGTPGTWSTGAWRRCDLRQNHLIWQMKKACGADEIPNEALKTLPFEHLVTLKNIFNRIINSGSYPLIWSKSIIHPIFKSGDRDNSSNYRGIALISNLSKLFTSILKSRLRNWIEGRSVIPENQAGFRKDYSCQDHIFTLLSLIQLTLRRKRRKLCAFLWT